MGLVNFLIKIGLDTTDVNIGVKRVESSFVGLGGSLGKALGPYLTAGAFAAFIRSSADAADAVGDLAEQANESTDNIQRLQALAGRSGVDVEKYIAGLVKLGEARNKALSGDEKSQLLFSRFGISADDLKSNQTNLDLLIRAGDEFNKQKESTSAQADAADLLGLKMAKVMATIGGIKELGPISLIGKPEIDTISKANDSLGEMWRTVKAFGASAIVFPFASLINSGGNLSKARDEYQKRLRDSLVPKTASEADGTESAEQAIARRAADQKWADARMVEIEKTQADQRRKRDLQRDLDQALSGTGFSVDSAVTRGAFFGGSDRQAQLGQGMNALKFRIEKLTEQIAEVNQKLDGN